MKLTAIHSETLMDLKHTMWAEHLQKYDGSVMLRGDSVNDDTGCQAVFAKQLSFVSHKSSRHNNPSTWNVWEASAAASGYTQVKMKYAPRLLRHLGTELSTIWIRPGRNRRPANWDKIDEPVFPWQAMCTATLWLDFCGNANWKEDCCKKVGGRPKVGKALDCDRKTKLFLSVYVDEIKMLCYKDSPPPVWTTLRKKIEVNESNTIHR